MYSYLISGIVMGIILYLGKMGTVYLIKRIPPFSWIKGFFHTIPGLLITDIGMGFLGAKTLASVGANGVTASFTLITFGFCTFIYIFTILGTKKVIHTYNNYKETKYEA